MNNCPNCGKVSGLHSSILQGCMCQYSMQAPPQRTWVGLTDEEMLMIYGQDHEGKKYNLGRMVQQALKDKNT